MFRSLWSDQPHVLEGLNEDAAEADKHDRSPMRVATSADDKLQSSRCHALDEDAVEPQARLRAFDIVEECLPAFPHAGSVGDIKKDAASFRLMRQRSGLCFHDN